MMGVRWCACVLCSWLLSAAVDDRQQRVNAQSAANVLKAFPDAEGWGAVSQGGRGGKVIQVTNLNAKGPGSLAEACAASGRRIVVFEVSGVIHGDIRIVHPYITIAGQTAPGAGITVEGVVSSFDHGVHDVILRHLRVRPPRATGSGGDCLQLGGLGPERTGTYNIMLDHLSLSWGNDEMIDFYNTHHATIQWCSIEESDGLGHAKGEHNFGMISTAEDSGAISVHHNLWAHHSRRVPCMAPYRADSADDFCNNFIYNCRGGYVDDGHGNRAHSPVNLHKNYYRRGPQTQSRMYPYALSPEMMYYVHQNYFEEWGYQAHPKHWRPANQAGGVPRWIQYNNNGGELDQPAAVPHIETVDAKEVPELVLNKAGCWPHDRVTKRTIDEVRNSSGQWGRNAPLAPSDEWYLEGLTASSAAVDSDGDGMPDDWERKHDLDANDNSDAARLVPKGASTDDRHQGYTYIEFYINELADALVQ
jgi:pectate lyase